jgi:hypothetical protein
MSNALHIDRVEVRYRKDGRRAFGFLLYDDFESDNLLCFDAEGDVPRTLRGLVELCREEYFVNAIDLLERCAEEGHPAYLDGEPVGVAELADLLAETRDD